MSEIDILRKNVFDNLQEIERLNNIINQFEEWLNDLGAWCYVEKLKELKESGNNE